MPVRQLADAKHLPPYLPLLFRMHRSQCQDPLEAMLYVGAFAVATYSTTAQRISKPFNPLLGETFDLILGDMRCVVEQVRTSKTEDLQLLLIFLHD